MDLRGWVITLLSVVLPAWLCFRYAPSHVGTIEVFGLCLGALGMGLVTVARIQLGRAFTVRAKARTLVRTGLYAKLRNPIYVFSAVALSGLALYFDKAPYLLGLLVLIPLQILRARTEARVLEEKFGEEYVRYKRSTWF